MTKSGRQRKKADKAKVAMANWSLCSNGNMEAVVTVRNQTQTRGVYRRWQSGKPPKNIATGMATRRIDFSWT